MSAPPGLFTIGRQIADFAEVIHAHDQVACRSGPGVHGRQPAQLCHDGRRCNEVPRGSAWPYIGSRRVEARYRTWARQKCQHMPIACLWWVLPCSHHRATWRPQRRSTNASMRIQACCTRTNPARSDANHHAAGKLFFIVTTLVAINYCNDVGVFESIDFNTKLTIRDDRVEETVSGSHRYITELGVVGDHTTNYTLACRRSKQ